MTNRENFFKKYEDAIAIVGIGCRFPGGANDAEKFWDLISNGEDVVVPIPKNRWDRKTFYNKNRNCKGKTVSQYGGFLDNIDEFDAEFFGITPREAPFLDPQQRLLLETSWEAMEDAGFVVENYAGKDVGVYVGAFTLDYKILQFGGNNYDLIDVHTATGAMMTMVANRISYAFDFTGPSMAIDTACSSSLVSIHTACQSIRHGECKMALAGGVLLNMAPQYTVAESQGGFLSVDGKCKTFDESANGYVRGEGVGVVVLKPLKDAMKDNDTIYSVILGSAVNQDGHTSSITVPNPEAQKKVIRAALKNASVEAKDIQYVEMHGTGTSVGDPLEAEAISTIMSEGRDSDNPCIVGSVKTNIGHTEGAAGVASIIKTSLCLTKKEIPPHLNLHTLNPKINLEKFNIQVSEKLQKWPENDQVALAGVNGFGFGGTNSHIVLSEAPAKKMYDSQYPEEMRLYPITARAEEALKDYVVRYKELVEKDKNINMYDLGYSMAYKRDRHNHRLSFMAKNREQLLVQFDRYLNEESELLVQYNKKKKTNGVTFVYTGMGPQWWRMGRDLMNTEPVFRAEVERCDKEFIKYSGWSLIEELSKSEEESSMSETRVAQPANFAIQVALTVLWKSKGVTPDVIVGHSAGEIAAFYCAGVVSFEDAIKIIYYRSSLQQRLIDKGKMLAVSLTVEEAQEYLERFNSVDIVAINSNSGLTLAGEGSDLQIISDELTEKKIFSKFLRVNVPFHSHFMEEIKDEFVEGVKGIVLNKPSVKLYSSVTGEFVSEVENNLYWWKNVRQTVLFARAVETILKDGFDTFVEIGPHPSLSNYINEIAEEKKYKVKTFTSLKRNVNEEETFYGAFAGLFGCGAIEHLNAMYPERGNYIKLPFYPWQRERYWLENEDARKRRLGIFDHIILGHRVPSATPCWELELNDQVLAFLPDHKIQGNTVFPAAGYMEMAIEAAKQNYGEGFYVLSDIEFVKVTFINPNKATRLQINLNQNEPSFAIYNMADRELVVKGRYKQRQMMKEKYALSQDKMDAFTKDSTLLHFEQENIYQTFDQMGFGYTNHFSTINEIYVNETHAAAKIELSDVIKAERNDFSIHPSILDACFQTVIATSFAKEQEDLRLPVGVGGFELYSDLEDTMWIICDVYENTEKYSKSHIFLYGANGNCIAKIEDFTVQVLETSVKKPDVKTIDQWLYEFDWREKELVEKDKRTGAWILLMDRKGIGSIVKEKLAEENTDCYEIVFGKAYQDELQEKHRITVALGSDEDMKHAIAACKEVAEFEGIIDCLNVDLADNEQICKDTILEVGDTGVYAFIRVVKSLEALGVNKTKIYTVTCGAQIVLQGEESQILQRPAWGVARLLRNQENTAYWGGVADLDPTAVAESATMFVTDLLKGDEEDQLAYRGGKRYVGRLNHIPNLTKPFPLTFQEDAYYLITGAFGELGQLVVNWMADMGAKKLILIGRSTVPAKDVWNDESLDDRTKERIAFVKNLVEKGVEIVPVNLDMADEDAINAYFAENQEMKKNIRGIISTAGMVNDKLMVEMPRETFDQVYNVKAIGNWTLHKQFEEQELDFFVLFSSITAMVTATGQINYISANSFLDGLCDYRRRKGQAALSIAWGPWDEGMIRKLNLQEVYIRKGMTPISGINGIGVLERVLEQDIPYALVVEADWDKVIDSVPRSTNPYLDHLKCSKGDDNGVVLTDEEVLAKFNDDFIKVDGDARSAFVLDTVNNLVGKVLHIPAMKIEPESSLNELGMDSMMSTELKNRIEMNTGAVISIVELLNNQSITQLGEQVQKQIESLLELDSLEELTEELSDEELDALLNEVVNEA